MSMSVAPCGSKLVSIQMVELKNGESFNGHLIDCDTFMNITLREVYQTSADSDRFWKLKEVYIRGSTVRVLFYFQTTDPKLDFRSSTFKCNQHYWIR